MTDFSNKIEILGELYDSYRNDKDYDDFFYYNDLGLPLAYYAHNNLVTLSDTAIKWVESCWEKLLEILGYDEDWGNFFYEENELLDWKTELHKYVVD